MKQIKKEWRITSVYKEWNEQVQKEISNTNKEFNTECKRNVIGIMRRRNEWDEYIHKERRTEGTKERSKQGMDKEMCMERKNEMKKYIRKEAKKEIRINIYEECKMQCV